MYSLVKCLDFIIDKCGDDAFSPFTSEQKVGSKGFIIDPKTLSLMMSLSDLFQVCLVKKTLLFYLISIGDCEMLIKKLFDKQISIFVEL